MYRIGPRPFAAVHVQRQTHHDLRGVVFFNEVLDALDQQSAIGLFNHLHRLRRETQWIGDRHSGAALAVIHGQNAHVGFAHSKSSRPRALSSATMRFTS